MKRFALIGHPVAGSLSPRLFQAAYGGRYSYDLVDEPDFETAWNRFLLGYEAINVTAPFKEDAFRRVDVLDPLAREAGAVNLVLRTPSGTKGYNTDVAGVREALLELPELPVGTSLVVGCSGAGRAAALALRSLDFPVLLTNRTAARAEALAREFGMETVPMERLREALLASALVVWAIPAPLPGIGPSDFTGRVLLEANYRTPSFREAEIAAAGGTYLSGVRWLVRQGAAGYGLMTGETPDLAKMLQSIQK